MARWYEITKDYATREEALAQARKYSARDKGHSLTRIKRKRSGWTVVQTTKRHIEG